MLTDSHAHNFSGTTTISIASRIIETISNDVGKAVESLKLELSRRNTYYRSLKIAHKSPEQWYGRKSTASKMTWIGLQSSLKRLLDWVWTDSNWVIESTQFWSTESTRVDLARLARLGSARIEPMTSALSLRLLESCCERVGYCGSTSWVESLLMGRTRSIRPE